MGWNILNVSLALSATSINCQDGKVTATVTVTGTTDESGEANYFTASLRDDHVIADILWDSGPQEIGSGETLKRSFEVELWCNKRCKVVGPAGSSGEKSAEIYAHVLGGEREGQSDNIPVSCIQGSSD